MTVATIRGIELNYDILGERGPWVALQPGGRRGGVSVRPLAEKIAEAGYRVLVYDRRNCGASGIGFEGGSEDETWAEDLHALLQHLDAAPAFVGGSSSGCRLALVLALRHPADLRGLLLWRVTGGRYAAAHLKRQYYTQYIEMAEAEGLEAVCRSEHFAEVIRANPGNRERLLRLGTDRFIAAMKAWRDGFAEGERHPVIGVSPQQLRTLNLPACIAPGNDRVHPRLAGQAAHRLMPNAEYREVLTEDRPDLDVAFEDWEAKEGLLAAVFIDFLRRQAR